MHIKHFFVSLFCLFLFGCAESQKPILYQLPDAIYPKSHPIDYGFGDWVIIKINNDAMHYTVAKTPHTLRSFEEMTTILCEELSKKNKLEFNKPRSEERFYRTLILELDSSTRYGLFDHAVELLKRMHLNKFYIRTRSTQDSISGFSIVFPETHELTKPYLARLYGEKINATYDFYQDCLGENKPPPPPGSPPPPPPMPDSLRFLVPVETLKSVIKTGNFGKNILIEMQNGQLFLNKKQVAPDALVKAVQMPQSGFSFFILLGEKNNYGDLIKIMDLLNTSREKLNNTYAQEMFGLDFAKLDRQQKMEVKNEDPFMWVIVSISEQLYIHASNH